MYTGECFWLVASYEDSVSMYHSNRLLVLLEGDYIVIAGFHTEVGAP